MIDGGSMPPHHFGDNHPNYNKHHPDSTKEKISQTRKNQKGKQHSAETRKRMRESAVKLWTENRKSGRCCPVMCVELNKVFDSAKDAAAFMNVSRGYMSRMIHTGKQYAGLTWKFV